MVLLRSLVFFFFFVVLTLTFGLVLALLGWFMPLDWKERLSNTWSAIVLWLLKSICRLDYRVEGSENLPREAAIVMAPTSGRSVIA